MWLYPVPIGIGPGRGGGACNRELRRIPIPRTRVNKGKKKGRGLQDRLGALDRPEHLTFTTGRPDQSEQHADRGGLAGTVRADDLVDLGGHQLVQDTEPDADRQRHQALLRCAGQLAESPLDAVGQLASPVLLSHGDLLGRYVPHGGSSCPRCWTSTPRTLSARADEAGGPPSQVLRA